VRLTQSSRRLYDRLQNGLQVGRRAADDTEHVTRIGLVFERLYQLALARLFLLEQPRVLDGDDGLVGEGLQPINLSVPERAHLGPPDGNSANGLARADQWDDEYGVGAKASRDVAARWVLISLSL